MSVVRPHLLLNRQLYNIGRRLFCNVQCLEERKGLILGVYEGENSEPCFTPAAEKFNNSVNGLILDLLKTHGKLLTQGKARLFNNISDEIWAVAVVGLGKEGMGYNELEAINEGMESVRAGSALGAQLLAQEGVTRLLVEGLGYPEQAGEGTALALWRFQDYKNPEQWQVIPTIELYDDPDTDSFQRGLYKAESQNLARKLCDTPANLMTPLHFAQETINALCPCGIKVEVHDRDWMEHNKFEAFLAAARGSCEPPLLIEMSYCGGPIDQKPILMVGKGVTFDSGGLCIKKCNRQSVYRGDLTGAAAIVGAFRSVAALNLPANITAVIALHENMPSGMAMKCGDIVMGKNGKSIMITDTDNEGRISMADSLVYGQQTHKPRLVIDVASLTYGVGCALGSAASGVFCNSQTIWSQVRKAGVITGDRVWRLPLWKYYMKKVTDFPSHDVDNKGKGKAGPCLGAAFLNEFVQCVDWVHFDTTGVGMLAEEKVYPYYLKGRMTGRPTRTLVQLLYQLTCPQEGARELK